MRDAHIGVDRRARTVAIVGVAAVHLIAITGLISAFSVDVAIGAVRSIAAFDVPLPIAPPPKPKPSSTSTPTPARVSTAQSRPRPPSPAPSQRATPSPDLPVAVLRPVLPSPATTLPAANERVATRDEGSGLRGMGAGSGGTGRDGASAGGIVRRAQKLGGELDRSDYPRASEAQRIGRAVVVRYDVGIDGRVRNCWIAEPSGNPEADAITCRLIEKRFRYRPAEDARGKPLPDRTGWKQWWYL